jgi:hypothetical protein
LVRVLDITRKDIVLLILGTVLGAVGGYGFSLVTPPPERVKSRLFGLPSAAALSGSWDVVWKDWNNIILPKESIDLSNPTGPSLEGKGYTPELGKYELSGIVGEFAVGLSYQYPVRPDLVGTVVLHKEPDASNGGIKLVGTWSQFSAKQGKIVSGTTLWTRSQTNGEAAR